ncbi:MAG: GNAT family N-acetyltransferase [Ktedonobacterales bacterium]|nr:GNAT family N-acetyltransferase [Ktedonobacterales bacterium]
MHVVIEPMAEADLADADAVLIAAYEAARTRVPELRRVLALQPDGWLLARLEGEAVGVAGAVDFGPFAYIGMVGVRPDRQRQGIGVALMERLLAWVDARGCPMALLDASDAGAGMYPRLGFVTDDLVGVWRLEEPSTLTTPTDTATAATVATARAGDLPELAAFDAPYFGAERGAVLAAYLRELPARTFIVRDVTGRLTGYLYAQARSLGPWVATTPTAAEALLARALTLPFSEPPRALTPQANGAARALLQRAGFREQRVLRHMRRGGARQLTRRRHLYGQASFALG